MYTHSYDESWEHFGMGNIKKRKQIRAGTLNICEISGLERADPEIQVMQTWTTGKGCLFKWQQAKNQ